MLKQLDAKIKILEDTDEKVFAVLNGEMGMQPPIQGQYIKRSHRLRHKGDGNGPHRPRKVVLRFASERLQDYVYQARTQLKTHNAARAISMRAEVSWHRTLAS